MTSVKNKAAIVKNIKKLTTEGGTTMGPALKECGKQLANFEGDYKYIVTLSDGEPFDSESELKKIVLSLSNQGITTSFINIENTDSTAVALLKKLATVGGGMYKYVKSATALGAAMREMIVNEINLTKVEPEIGESFDIQYSFKNKNDAVLDNVGSLNDITVERNWQPIRSYISTTRTCQMMIVVQVPSFQFRYTPIGTMATVRLLPSPLISMVIGQVPS